MREYLRIIGDGASKSTNAISITNVINELYSCKSTVVAYDIWDGMAEFIKDIGVDQGILIYPYLWSNECDINSAKKSIVPMDEIISLNAEYVKMFNK